MKIALLGYGRMGKEIEKKALERGHQIHLVIDNEQDWVDKGHILKECDAAIDFSIPACAMDNIDKCFAANTPLVIGTTGWHNKIEEIRKKCEQGNHTMIWGSNFSIGVNIFFSINKKLAQLMNNYPDYSVDVEEIHHTAKLDAPSGTAISLANDIINNMDRKNSWVNEIAQTSDQLTVISKREPDIPGTHIIKYMNEIDTIEISHIAKNRIGFAIGSVMAAEWIQNKKGFFNVTDWLNF